MPAPLSAPTRFSSPLLVGLALVAATTLAFEVFLTRLLAYTVPTLLIYVVLGVAMTGFGAASTVLAVRPPTTDVARAMSRWAAWLALLLVGACALFVRVAPWLAAFPPLAFVVAALLTLPFFAAGSVITLALTRAGDDVRRVYAFDLLGSGLGCLLPFVLLRPLGASGFIALCALLAAVASVVLARAAAVASASRARGWLLPLLGTASALAAFGLGDSLFPIEAEPTGQVAVIQRAAPAVGYEVVRTFDRWNVTGRVEHFEFHHVPGGPEPYPFRFYAQDNTAGALMARWDRRDVSLVPPQRPDGSLLAPLCSDTFYGQAYWQRRERVLVIGVGGAADVQCALYFRATHVDAIEINPDTIAAIRGPFDDFLGGVGNDPRVTYHIRDGRSFVHAAPEGGYDLVQLSGVDTKQHLASGALAMSENLLYTREAFVDYLSRLTPGGALSVIYFGEPAALRLVDTIIAAFHDLGVEHPERHLLVAQNAHVYGIVATRAPLDAAALDAYEQRFWFDDRPFVGFHALFLDPFGYAAHQRPEKLYAPGEPESPLFSGLITLASAGRASEFEAGHAANVKPVSDDRPFFFDTTRYDRPGQAVPLHLQVLRATLWSVLLLAVLFVVLPVWKLRRGLGAGSLLLGAVYFSCIGFGFLFVEVWLLHRFAMFLGHQTLSLGVVLATLLLATGAGSLFGGRLGPSPARRIVLGVGGLLLLLLVDYLLLPRVFDGTWRLALAVRVGIAVGVVAPLGVMMGVCFPAGLEWLGARHEAALPWGVGINFFASVGATVAVVPLALFGGYAQVLALGAALYLGAGVSGALMRRPSAA